MGVGRGDARRDLADHVLATFEPEERPVIEEAIAAAADAVAMFVAEGIGPVMNRFNASARGGGALGRRAQQREKDSQS